MTENSTSPSSGSKRALIIGGSVIVALAVVYFAFFYPPASVRDTEGTIGAVKKYRAEQITEKDIVLEGMTSMNIEAVNKAVEQTGSKLAESAREASKAADAMIASARTPQAKTYFEGLSALANKAEALKAPAADSRTPLYEAAAALVDAAKQNAMKFEGLTADAKTPEALKAWEGVRVMGRLASNLRDLGVRAEYLKLNDAVRELGMKVDALKADALKADAVRVDAMRAEWNNLAEAATALARQADGLKPFYGKTELGKFSEGALAFAKCAHALRAGNEKQFSAEGLNAALDAARVMASRGEMLARTQPDQRLAPAE